ncbi:MAG: porin family protein [Myxococcales bacterium]|nr:porin family protein [Myxococcales bacterium]
MVTTLTLLAVALLAIPSASAHWSPYPHYHVVPRYYVVPQPVRVVRQAPRPEREFYDMIGIGVRGSGFYLHGTKFNLSNLENPMMGGVGLQFRSKFSPHWGLEFAVEYIRGKKETLTQQTFPVTLAMLFYFLPKSRIQPYLLAGLGAHFTQLKYANDIHRSLTEIVVPFGGGVEIRIGRHFAVNADVRGLAVWKIIGDQITVPERCSEAGACDGVQTINTKSKFNIGLQFLAAVSYYF